MRKQHIEIGNEEALEGVAKTRMHKASTQRKKRKAAKAAKGSASATARSLKR
jgi:hypothetical protein